MYMKRGMVHLFAPQAFKSIAHCVCLTPHRQRVISRIQFCGCILLLLLCLEVWFNIIFSTMAATTNVKASLEITKGATATDPIPIDTSSTGSIHDEHTNLLGPFPTEEEWATLPRVAGRIPWQAWTVAAVEFVERFSYYGTSAVFVSEWNLEQHSLACIDCHQTSSRSHFPLAPRRVLDFSRSPVAVP
jgi:hypothetical protein